MGLVEKGARGGSTGLCGMDKGDRGKGRGNGEWEQGDKGEEHEDKVARGKGGGSG